MKRSDRRTNDRREGIVYVDEYSKSNGSHVSSHTRRPAIRAKMKLRINHDGTGRISGKATTYNRQGKKMSSERINEPIDLNRMQLGEKHE